MLKISQNPLDKEILKKEPKELFEICEALFAKGKNLRSQLTSLISSHLQLKKEDIQFLCRIIEYIHNSSLLHDDFIDNSDFRRKQKTAWVQFSPQQAVLAGDYLLAQVNVYLCEKENLSLLKLTAESIKSLVRGEFLQREFYGFRQKDLEKINEVSEHKTGSLFKWCLKAPFILQGKQEAAFYDLLETIGRYLGWLYQRSDDLLDFDSQKESDKPRLCDLKQTYYNSFSCYLTKDLDPSLEKKYQNCKSISEVHQCMPHFEATLKLFHEDNQKIIKKTEEKMEEISSFLDPETGSLISELKAIPSLLYWRKK